MVSVENRNEPCPRQKSGMDVTYNLGIRIFEVIYFSFARLDNHEDWWSVILK